MQEIVYAGLNFSNLQILVDSISKIHIHFPTRRGKEIMLNHVTNDQYKSFKTNKKRFYDLYAF